MIKKLRILVEIIFLYATLVGINLFFFPYYPVWMGIDPHPFWIGVFLFSFRYGLFAGFVSGLMALSLYVYFAAHTAEAYFLEDVSFYLLPSFFIVVGVVVGFVSNQYKQKTVAHEVVQNKLIEQIKTLEREIKISKEIIQGLEKRIVTRMSTLVTLYEGARKLESVHADELYTSALDFVTKTLEAESVSLYLRRGDSWFLKTKIGFEDYQKVPELVGFEEGIIGQAGALGKIVTIRDNLGEVSPKTGQLMGDCLFAGPIISGINSSVEGVIAIHKIPFLSFNSATINLFRLLLDWVGRAMGRAHLFEEMRENEIVDPDFHVYSYRYFRSRLDQEFARSKKYSLPLSVIFVKSLGLSALDGARKRAYLRVLSQFLKANCREIDVVGCYSETEVPFAIMLATTSEKQAAEEIIRLKNIYSHFNWPQIDDGWQGRVEFVLSSYRPTDQDLSDLVGRAA